MRGVICPNPTHTHNTAREFLTVNRLKTHVQFGLNYELEVVSMSIVTLENASAADIKAKLDLLISQQSDQLTMMKKRLLSSENDTQEPKSEKSSGNRSKSSVNPVPMPADISQVGCTICGKSDEDFVSNGDSDNDDEQLWIQCDAPSCGAWVHVGCDGMTAPMLSMFRHPSKYFCPSCRAARNHQTPADRWAALQKRSAALGRHRKERQTEQREMARRVGSVLKRLPRRGVAM